MALTRRTLDLVAALRAELADIENTRTRALTASWVRAWDTLRATTIAGLDDLLLQVGQPGSVPSRGLVVRTSRLMAALDTARTELEKLAAGAVAGAVADTRRATDSGSAAQAGIIDSQLPTGAGWRATSTGRGVLEQIVARTTQQITVKTRPIGQVAYETMLRALIRGVAVGDNPRSTAAGLLRDLEGGFNGGLTRALVVSRTEMLDAYRAAAQAEHAANAGVLSGWTWQSSRDKRTCPSCWSKDGNQYPLDVPGPQDHAQGRCVRLPVTRSWRDLGIAMREPPPAQPAARAVFDAMSPADQLAVMGPGRLAAVQSGAADWADLSTLRRTPGWRDSYTTTPVRQLGAATTVAA